MAITVEAEVGVVFFVCVFLAGIGRWGRCVCMSMCPDFSGSTWESSEKKRSKCRSERWCQKKTDCQKPATWDLGFIDARNQLQHWIFKWFLKFKVHNCSQDGPNCQRSFAMILFNQQLHPWKRIRMSPFLKGRTFSRVPYIWTNHWRLSDWTADVPCRARERYTALLSIT